MRLDYENWLRTVKKYSEGTITAQLHRAGRVEKEYGDLDQHYRADKLDSVVASLTYSVADERRNRPNPSRIPFNGDVRKNLSSYSFATSLYRQFLEDHPEDDGEAGQIGEPFSEEIAVPETQLFGLERDMQRALRQDLHLLEPGLQAADEGVERRVSSGYIDILARAENGDLVVIELKAGKGRRDVIGQILSYMGDLQVDEPDETIRGMIVASDFDAKVYAAISMVPSVLLKKYSISFAFEDC